MAFFSVTLRFRVTGGAFLMSPGAGLLTPNCTAIADDSYKDVFIVGKMSNVDGAPANQRSLP